MKKSVTVLGATGSVGHSTLKIIRENPDKFQVIGITANSNVTLLAKLAFEFMPKFVVISDFRLLSDLETRLAHVDIEILSGGEGLDFLASQKTDILVAAISGFAGFKPIFKAISVGTDIAIANKEALVAGGHLLMPLAKRKDVNILPIDSEHNAIFQCMMGQHWDDVENVTLTASGGPFLSITREDMHHIRPVKALKHPTWNMGAKISIDSATMMNKGLETIEAAWLFGIGREKVSAVIHPQSIMHGFVKFWDGTIISHMAPPDMKVPISHALAWPERLKIQTEKLDLTQIARLEFTEINNEQFPCYDLAHQLIGENPCYAVALNAANEIAVSLYLDNKLAFGDIYSLCIKTLDMIKIGSLDNCQSVIDYDSFVRDISRSIVLSL